MATRRTTKKTTARKVKTPPLARIKRVQVRGLKGKTCDLNLSTAITTLAGPNGVGKTAVLDGIELALTGQHRVWGKATAGLRRLGERYTVDLTTSQGESRIFALGEGKPAWTGEADRSLRVLDVEGLARASGNLWRQNVLSLAGGGGTADLAELEEQAAAAKRTLLDARAELRRLKTACAENKPPEAVASPAEVTQIKRAVKALEQRVAKLREEEREADHAAGAAGAAKERIKRARADWDAAAERLDALDVEEKEAVQDHSEAKERLARLTSTILGRKQPPALARLDKLLHDARLAWTEARFQAEAAGKRAASATCPTCGQKIPASLRKQAKELRVAATQAEKRLEDLTALREAVNQCKFAHEDLAEIRRDLPEAKKEVKAKRASLRRVERSVGSAADAAVASKAAQAAREALSEAEDELAAARDDLEAATEASAASTQWRRLAGEVTEAEATVKRAKADLEAATVAVRDALAEVTAPLRKAAALAAKALEVKIDWSEDCAPEVDGHPWATLSSGERLVFWTALASGLYALEGKPLRVLLLDNVEALDRGHREALYTLLGRLIKQRAIGQAILALACDKAPQLPGRVEVLT